jgi:diguanylate cyclase (GGDEF)-like protein
MQPTPGRFPVKSGGVHAGVLTTHADPILVCVSVAVAILGSYAALDLIRRSAEAMGWTKRLWVLGGGVTMGVGIWSMHFIGMLALRMDMPVSYNGVLVVLSLIAAVAGSSVALAVVSRPHASRRGLLSAAGFMGLAVAAMHYLGMASMEMAASIHWNIWLVAASIAIGLVASLIALSLFARIGSRQEGFGFTRRVGAAVLLGVGVAGLHYTAMAASTFTAVSGPVITHHGFSTRALVVLLLVGAGIMLAVLIGGAAVDQRRATLATDLTIVANIARELGRVGDTRGRICKAIQDLTAADYVLLKPPDDHAGPTAIVGLPSNTGSDVEMQSGLHQLPPGSTILYEPLTLESQSVGMLLIGWEGRAPRLSDRTTTLVSMVAAEGAVAIDRENLLIKLDELARRDELTGLFNRRVLAEQLDHFKRYNDTHGHQAGDQLLASAAVAWTNQLRAADIIARYGGEEFIIILPNCSLEEAILTADRVREAVPRGATCSAGVAAFERGDSAAQLIGRADRALYDAKATGRNRTSVAPSARTSATVPARVGQ